MSAIWEKIQGPIKERIGSTAYETWFSPLRAEEKTPETLIIQTPDDFFKNWVIEHYLDLITDSVLNVSTKPVAIEFQVNAQILKQGTQVRLAQLEKNFQSSENHVSNLNPRFTFDNFVVGASNRFAHAASLAVAESPAKAYNPLFVYGGVGLGKTHLMQSIAQKIHATNPKLKHAYITSERFTNELIDAIRHRSGQQFRQKYRTIDVILIDDIQFIAGKESTQEEFFHTFNALHNDRKQIIVSSDRPPKEIPNLEERLVSRFTWGLVADIQPPDFETRVAILRKKIEREPVPVPDDVILFIAQEIKTNIRELEGALIRVAAYSLLEEKPVSLEMAQVILKDMVKESIKTVSADMIQKAVANFFDISLADIKTGKRNKNIVLPRQVAMYLTRQLTNLSLPEIGSAFGGKDHTTVLHSWKKINAEIKTDNSLKNAIEKLTTDIKQ
ncbi:MAG TPA: chromosomal replication initiator protein DnaA [Candidatus Omnitrophota bacterium]|nr:chromosomal replication initiator protein DnaA [Candidatus Omnitrophota bacterium]HPD84592.1 chromosomal replication initiator protein DnaA [Candidatus Omnitrophota bacterium]HRZ03450.1 chromosomal replication initiator protein DnaA [Candidatus Omnitrophota bacterium]